MMMEPRMRPRMRLAWIRNVGAGNSITHKVDGAIRERFLEQRVKWITVEVSWSQEIRNGSFNYAARKMNTV